MYLDELSYKFVFVLPKRDSNITGTYKLRRVIIGVKIDDHLFRSYRDMIFISNMVVRLKMKKVCI